MESKKLEFFNEGFEEVIPIPAAQEGEYREVAWGIEKIGDDFQKLEINRGNIRETDVKIDGLYCGICHTDVHMATNQLGQTCYPIVPGHEFVGKVVEVGAKVTKFKVGDNVGIGVMIDSCTKCEACENKEEQYCSKGFFDAYNSFPKFGHVPGNMETQQFGGYSGSRTLHEYFCFKIPDEIPLESAGPLLCAGVTMYDPLRHFGATKPDNKMNIGVIGIGGLGTMGIKLAKALGHTVVAISTSADKKALAFEKGAEGFVCSKDPESMKAYESKLDLILNTVSVDHQASFYVPLVRHGGTLVQIGMNMNDHSINQMTLLPQRKSISGSLIGGTQATQEMLEFCAKHQIFPDIELVDSTQLTEVFQKLIASNKDAKRYVLDIKKSLEK